MKKLEESNRKMRTHLRVFAILLLSAACLAQRIPVSMQSPATSNEDETALKFTRSLADEVQLSARFTLWTGNPYDLPTNGVRVLLRSIQVTSGSRDLGSAIFVEAQRQSVKDPGYYEVITEQLWMIPKDNSVAEETRFFLAKMDRALEKQLGGVVSPLSNRGQN